jgi:hypothetical protein
MNFWTIVLLVGVIVVVWLIRKDFFSYKKYNEDIRRIDSKTGQPTKVVNLYDFYGTNIDQTIRVYESPRLILLGGELYNFEDIVSVSMSTRTETEEGEVKAVTKQSTVGTIGRAMAGKIIAGNTGALIGASTAKQHTTYIKSKDEVKVEYIIDVTLNNLRTPLYTIKIEDNREKAAEVYSLIEIIIKQNEKW